jgi:Polysaccharide pyruvyl transferase
MSDRKIVLFGAFDRFNYGDLLFPIIFCKLHEAVDKVGSDIEFVGLRQSNLSRFGGFPTQPVSYLTNSDNLPDGSVVVVAGGELIGQSWAEMHGSLIPPRLTLVPRVLNKLISQERLNRFSRRYFAADWEFPYVVCSDDFGNEVSVVYNTVGALSLARRDHPTNERVHKALSKATFLSVRDATSQKLLNKDQDIAKLFPDSAMLVSKLFPKEVLLDLVNAETRDFLRGQQKGHLCFQISRGSAERHIATIANQLDHIYAKFALQIVLLPIGRATYHEDQTALQAIKRRMRSPAVLPKPNGVYDIMALLSYAKVVVGTSLHGIITGMSYGVPYVALTGVDKLQVFLDTWSINALKEPARFDQLVEAVDNAMSVSNGSLASQKADLRTLAEQGMADLLQAVRR